MQWLNEDSSRLDLSVGSKPSDNVSAQPFAITDPFPLSPGPKIVDYFLTSGIGTKFLIDLGLSLAISYRHLIL